MAAASFTPYIFKSRPLFCRTIDSPGPWFYKRSQFALLKFISVLCEHTGYWAVNNHSLFLESCFLDTFFLRSFLLEALDADFRHLQLVCDDRYRSDSRSTISQTIRTPWVLRNCWPTKSGSRCDGTHTTTSRKRGRKPVSWSTFQAQELR